MRDRAAFMTVALAVTLRLAWVLLVPTRPVGDFAMYLESAAHLVEFGAFDPEFVYMPGYVALVAAVQWLGGGLLAIKLLGVGFAGLAAAAIWGIAARLFDRRAAIVATLLYAVWPAGIAVSSVTGTDMPAAALIAGAVWCLVRWGPGRPLVAAGMFGLVIGLAAFMRAVAIPLAALSAGYWIACRAAPRAVVARTALAVGVAVAALSPWAIRNHLRYGELFLTDSHGGHTALVGSNPSSDGVYTRSLNLMFQRATGYRILAEPHRASDRAAYALAREWAGFEPLYSFGLMAARADRLLTRERGLLYWPVFRQGVLEPREAAWFVRHRAALEGVVDAFWFALIAAAGAGAASHAVRRRYTAVLSLLPFQAALAGIYILFFAEPRYHLPVAVLAFPLAASALGGFPRPGPVTSRPVAAAILVIGFVFLGWPALIRGGAALRERHRWTAALCDVAGEPRLCKWRRYAGSGAGPSPVRGGCFDAVGLRLPDRASPGMGVAVETAVSLPAGRYQIRATAEPPADPSGSGAPSRAELRVDLETAGGKLATATLPPGPYGVAAHVPLEGTVDHPGGDLRLIARLAVADGPPGPRGSSSPLWLSDLHIEPAAAIVRPPE